MAKVIEGIRLTSALDPGRSVELDAVVDTGATMLVLPIEIVERLGLKKVRDVRVRCASGGSEPKGIYGIVNVEIKGRAGNFDVIAEAEGTQPLVGEIVLEELDLVVDPRSRALTPNPNSPDMAMVSA